MPHLPLGANPNILANFAPDDFELWMGGADIPERGPHTKQTTQFGCTINTDFTVESTRSTFKKGMQGHLIEVKDNRAKIFIRGVTESCLNGHWVANQWVSTNYVTKGAPLEENVKDWNIKMNLFKYPRQDHRQTHRDFSHIPSTIHGLQIEDLIKKRGISIENICETIIKGIKKANLYDILNKPNFTVMEVIGAASNTINCNYPKGTGGIYIRYHKSTSSGDMMHWRPKTAYAYIGKTVDFRDCYDYHPHSTSEYGELSQNSQQLVMSGLCVLSEKDNLDFGYLVEQIFICFFASYRSDLLVRPSGNVQTVHALEHIEAIEAALYFRETSEKVFREIGYTSAVNRADFGVRYGANYSMPYKQWARRIEQKLFVRLDTHVKDKVTGRTIPMAVFRTAKPMVANYSSSSTRSGLLMGVFMKRHQLKRFFTLNVHTRTTDGTTCPPQDALYQLVFEVRMDGTAHPQAWSRLLEIGPFINWDQGRSLAARIEWEHPPGSGKWRFRYIQAHTLWRFAAPTIPGSYENFYKAIALIQWLFNAEPNHARHWIPRLRGSAYVVQAVYDIHTQTLQIKPPTQPITMRSGGTKTVESIIAAMNANRLGLRNVNGEFGKFEHGNHVGGRSTCDTCTILGGQIKKAIGLNCTQIPGTNNCQVCLLFGRPCCSWTADEAVSYAQFFSNAVISGTSNADAKITSDNVAHNKILRSALVVQPKWVDTGEGQSFSQDLLDVTGLSGLEDDLSDPEDVEEEVDEEENIEDADF